MLWTMNLPADESRQKNICSTLWEAMTEFSSNQIVNNEGVRCFQSLSLYRKLCAAREANNYDIWVIVEGVIEMHVMFFPMHFSSKISLATRQNKLSWFNICNIAFAIAISP